MAAARLTSWEEHQLKTVELFFKRVKDAMDYFAKNEENLRGSADQEEERGFEEGQKDWLKFREIVMDLFSALDYTWYLLYCHFSNNGQPDLSEKCVHLGFPYRKKGVKVCPEAPLHDQTKKFAMEKMRLIWGERFNEDTHFWKEISQAILDIQPKDVVDSSGASVKGVRSQSGREESFALLHFYRNCAAHRDLIKFMPRKSWVQINQMTRETKLVNEKQDDQDGYFYKELDKGYWIELPEHLSIHGDTNRLLMDVLDQLLKSVKKTTNKLLQSANLRLTANSVSEPLAVCPVPKSHVILKGPYQTYMEVLESTELTSELHDELSRLVKITTGKEFTGRYQTEGATNTEEITEADMKKAIDEGVRLGLIEVRDIEWTVTPQSFKKTSTKTNLMILNELKQKMKNIDIDVEWSLTDHKELGLGDFETEMNLTITLKKNNILMYKVCSGEQRGKGKKKAEEAAATVVLEQLIERKIVELKEE